MLKVLAIVLLFAIAQVIPTCGGEGSDTTPAVIGWVQEKRSRVDEPLPNIIVINQVEYGVPLEFWRNVGVGDLVKFDGVKWTLVRKAS